MPARGLAQRLPNPSQEKGQEGEKDRVGDILVNVRADSSTIRFHCFLRFLPRRL